MIKHNFPKDPTSPYYKQFSDPLRAYYQLPAALQYFRDNPQHTLGDVPQDGTDYRVTAFKVAEQERKETP